MEQVSLGDRMKAYEALCEVGTPICGDCDMERGLP
jgi:hypothetical protein